MASPIRSAKLRSRLSSRRSSPAGLATPIEPSLCHYFPRVGVGIFWLERVGLHRLAAAQQPSSELGRRAVQEVEAEFFRLLADRLVRGRLGEAERRHREDVSAEPDRRAERQPERRTDPRDDLRGRAVERAHDAAEGIVHDRAGTLFLIVGHLEPANLIAADATFTVGSSRLRGRRPLSFERSQAGEARSVELIVNQDRLQECGLI